MKRLQNLFGSLILVGTLASCTSPIFSKSCEGEARNLVEMAEKGYLMEGEIRSFAFTEKHAEILKNDFMDCLSVKISEFSNGKYFSLMNKEGRFKMMKYIPSKSTEI